jgi:hypothetical protein
MGAAMGAADGHCDGLLVDGSLPGASLRLRLGMPLEISVGDSLGCMGGHRLGSADAIAEGMALGA